MGTDGNNGAGPSDTAAPGAQRSAQGRQKPQLPGSRPRTHHSSGSDAGERRSDRGSAPKQSPRRKEVVTSKPHRERQLQAAAAGTSRDREEHSADTKEGASGLAHHDVGDVGPQPREGLVIIPRKGSETIARDSQALTFKSPGGGSLSNERQS